MALIKISELPLASAITGSEIYEIVQAGINKQTSIGKVFADLGVVIYCGAYDLSGGSLSVLTGTGTAGAILKGNQFYVSVGGAIALPDGGNVLKGMVLQAKIDSPGNDLTDMSKWMVFSTNTD